MTPTQTPTNVGEDAFSKMQAPSILQGRGGLGLSQTCPKEGTLIRIQWGSSLKGWFPIGNLEQNHIIIYTSFFHSGIQGKEGRECWMLAWAQTPIFQQIFWQKNSVFRDEGKWGFLKPKTLFFKKWGLGRSLESQQDVCNYDVICDAMRMIPPTEPRCTCFRKHSLICHTHALTRSWAISIGPNDL